MADLNQNQTATISSVTEITLSGECDAQTALALDADMQQAVYSSLNHIIIDCTNLTYISSAGLGVLISFVREMEQANRKIVLFGLQEQILQILQLLTLEHVLSIATDRQGAVEVCVI